MVNILFTFHFLFASPPRCYSHFLADSSEFIALISLSGPSCVEGFLKGSLSLHGRTQPRGLSTWHEIAFKRWLCNSRDGVSSDDEYEYRSSRNIAISLLKRYRNVDECILWLSIVLTKILCTPQPTIVKWSLATPVSEDMLLQWNDSKCIFHGGNGLTLQLEQMALTGHAEEPSVVASRMRLVFSTLEVVSPQWPRV
ncbi:hypothetical protein AKJ16_DCAP05581 [Drosera capensis]